MTSRQDGKSASRQEESVCIEPKPTAEEAAAIVAALLLHEPADERAAADTASPWATAGRRAAMSGRDGGATMGWGRVRDDRRRR